MAHDVTDRCEALKAEKEADSGKDIKPELDELKSRYKRLKVSWILLSLPLSLFSFKRLILFSLFTLACYLVGGA